MKTAPLLMTRKTYLTLKAMEKTMDIALATEAVATTALAHPEWDMRERRSYAEWEASE